MPEQLNFSRRDREILTNLRESIDNLSKELTAGSLSSDEVEELLEEVKQELDDDLDLEPELENFLDEFIHRVLYRIGENGGDE